MTLLRLALLLALAAAPAAARDPLLNLPLDCTLGEDCYIQNYVDHDAGPGAADFACGPQSYDTHNGTDFALVSQAQMEAGVDVIAAAPGTVTAVRDGMEDAAYGSPGAPDVTGRECGNGVIVDHGGGWVTQYCHMKQGSIAVAEGRRVGTGTVLGQVGLSGQTQFPHVHLAVRHEGEIVDPFVPDGIVQCGLPPAGSLWQQGFAYDPGGLVSIGVSDRVPEFAEVTAGTAALPALRRDLPALVVWGLAHGSRAGDVMRLVLEGPDGTVLDEEVTLDKPQARVFRAVGLRARAHWRPGAYRAVVTFRRGEAELDRAETVLSLE